MDERAKPRVIASATGRTDTASKTTSADEGPVTDVAPTTANCVDDELFSVTPEDLAQTEKLDWEYLIKGDKVYKKFGP